MKFEIRHRWTGKSLFELETKSLRLAVETAVKSGADLRGADFRGADLGGADLGGAYLRGADFRGAYLGGAYLRGANLRDADLGGANFRGADLGDAKGINPSLCTPLLMLLDQPGKIRAYKLVTDKWTGPYYGKIRYQIGQKYENTNANTDITQQCAKGINLATLDWCVKEWKKGYHVLIAEFNAKDIAAIPTATDGKFRVCRCKIVGEKDLKEIGVV